MGDSCVLSRNTGVGQPTVFGTANQPPVLGIDLNTGVAGFVIRDRMQSQSVGRIVHRTGCGIKTSGS